MFLSADQLQVTSFPTQDVRTAAGLNTDEAECQSPRCGPTAAPIVCPDTEIEAA